MLMYIYLEQKKGQLFFQEGVWGNYETVNH